MDVDVLIIGQGLAGSLLAWELIQRNCKVIIIDNGRENASQVAAGLINPITGMRFVKSTDVDMLLTRAKQCYLELADVFQQNFYIEKPMLRLFRSEKELSHCLERLYDPDYEEYLGPVISSEQTFKNIAAPFGFLEQKLTGYLLTLSLLSCLKDFFIARHCYWLADVDYQDIRFRPTLKWQNIFPKQIVFCEGHLAVNNPWFSWLPFQLVKGEILTLAHQSQLPDKILNFGNWLIPLNSDHIRIGATFDRENLNTLPSEHGKKNLLNALTSISANLAQATLINHQANIRPCTLDKQPFVGHHPQYPQLAIFNGFGAKGSLQIPWYSRHFVDSLLSKKTTITSNIQRFYATHFTG